MSCLTPSWGWSRVGQDRRSRSAVVTFVSMDHDQQPPAPGDAVLGGKRMDVDTRATLFGMLTEFDRRDRTVVRRREEWARYGYMLAVNAQELDEYLSAEEVGLSSSMGTTAESAISEVERLVFNTCTAALARVDHHRRAIKAESDTFKLAYKNLIAPLGASDEHVLLTGLRQYVTHVGLAPLSVMAFLAVTGHDGLNFYVQRDALRSCDEFTKPRGRTALDRQPASIDLRALMSDYAAKAAEQDRAVLALYERVHADALRADADAWGTVANAWEIAGFGAWV